MAKDVIIIHTHNEHFTLDTPVLFVILNNPEMHNKLSYCANM
jgi:hypothetical protein